MTSFSSGQSVSFKVDTKPVEQLIDNAPRATYFWMHAYLREISRLHRSQWLSHKGTKFGRVSSGGRGIIVSRVNQGNVPPKDNEVSYQVSPKDERAGSAGDAAALLTRLRADIFTGNKILPVHEFGTDIHSQGWMAVPYKTRPGNIHRWKERNPQAKLLTLPSKKDGKRLVYELQHKAKFRVISKVTMRRLPGLAPGLRLAPVSTPPASKRFQRLRLRWVLTKDVKMNPTLKLYSSWDGLQSSRDEVWSRFMTRLVADVTAGKVT